MEKLQLKFDLKPRIMEALETRLKELEQKMLDINPKLQEVRFSIIVFFMHY